MYGRWFNIAIVFLWIVTMTWLIKEKVLPSLLTGSPPSQQSLLESAEADQDVGWLIYWGKRPIGWAKSHTERADDDTVRMTTDVHFDHLPISNMIPKWAKKLPSWTGLEAKDFSKDASLETDTTSEMILSSEGELQEIRSSITLVSLNQTIDMVGKLSGNRVALNISAEGFSYNTEIPLNPDVLMSNSLTPQTHLPGLYMGQTWMVGVVSPFRYPLGSMDVMYAKVVGHDSCHYNDEPIRAWLIEYHKEPNTTPDPKKPPRCKIWVHPDGMVLRQELRLFDANLIFERKPADQVVELYKKLK